MNVSSLNRSKIHGAESVQSTYQMTQLIGHPQNFWERTTGAPTINDKYSEPLINYDLNGNITQYQRRGLTTGTTYDQIDLMVYTYDAANPDRLYRIADLAPSASRPYGFKPKGVPSYYGFDNAGNLEHQMETKSKLEEC